MEGKADPERERKDNGKKKRLGEVQAEKIRKDWGENMGQQSRGWRGQVSM